MKRVFWDVGTEFLTLLSFVIQRVRIIQLALNPLAVASRNSCQYIPISFRRIPLLAKTMSVRLCISLSVRLTVKMYQSGSN